MIKRIYIISAIVLILAVCGILAYNNFEIVSVKKWIRPSQEYYSNNFLVLERWLNGSDISVSYSYYFLQENFNDITEKIIILPSWRCFWNYTDEILTWIENGGYLIVYTDRHRTDEEFSNFLSVFGISIDNDRKNVIAPKTNIVYPNMDENISIIVENEEIAYIEYDNSGIIRLADIPFGSGGITITGMPLFMYNKNLREEANAVLTWKLTGERASKDDGVLIIRDGVDAASSNSLLGALFERGNPIPLIVSAFVLIFIGFWMTIPVFGLVLYDKQRNSRPIKDRFTAEIKFLKKQHALTYYLDVYARENKDKITVEKEDTYSYSDLINNYRRIFNGTAKI